MDLQDLTERINGCAFAVYNRMGFGFLESVYEKCMMIELKKSGLAAERQKPIAVQYDGQPVGEFIADIVVEGKVIVELESASAHNPAHEAQLVNYLTATDIPVGLLQNFSPSGVEITRRTRDWWKKSN